MFLTECVRSTWIKRIQIGYKEKRELKGKDFREGLQFRTHSTKEYEVAAKNLYNASTKGWRGRFILWSCVVDSMFTQTQMNTSTT